MRTVAGKSWCFASILLSFCVVVVLSVTGPAEASMTMDARVEKFLDDRRSDWHDWNVPYEDGKVLHDLIVRHNYTRALEIGTSSGHSAIWMAWALSKTGGRLITIEIDEALHRKALQNFKA